MRIHPRPRRSAPLAVLLSAVLALAVAGCGAAGTGDKGYVGADGVITTVAPEDRREVAGEVSGETLDGQPWSLADQRGKVVVLNVWGTWCPPCRKEAPVLAEAARQLKADPELGDDVVFMGINTRDSSPAQGRAFERNFEVPYPSLFDPDGRTLLAFRGTITPNAIPSTLVIDRQGRVAARVLGEITSARTLVALVEDVDGPR